MKFKTLKIKISQPMTQMINRIVSLYFSEKKADALAWYRKLTSETRKELLHMIRKNKQPQEVEDFTSYMAVNL